LKGINKRRSDTYQSSVQRHGGRKFHRREEDGRVTWFWVWKWRWKRRTCGFPNWPHWNSIFTISSSNIYLYNLYSVPKI